MRRRKYRIRRSAKQKQAIKMRWYWRKKVRSMRKRR